jgi:hypothetical protein
MAAFLTAAKLNAPGRVAHLFAFSPTVVGGPRIFSK